MVKPMVMHMAITTARGRTSTPVGAQREAAAATEARTGHEDDAAPVADHLVEVGHGGVAHSDSGPARRAASDGAHRQALARLTRGMQRQH